MGVGHNIRPLCITPLIYSIDDLEDRRRFGFVVFGNELILRRYSSIDWEKRMTKTPIEEFAKLYHEFSNKQIEESDAFYAAHGYGDEAFHEVFKYDMATAEDDPNSIYNTTQAKVRTFLHDTLYWVLPHWLLWKVVQLVKLPVRKEEE